MEFYLALLIMAGAILCGVVFSWFVTLLDDTSSLRYPRTYSKQVRLTFVQFARLYVGAPDAWKVDKYTATYCGAEHYDVAFSLYSAWKYRRWWCNKERRAAQMKKLKDQADFIADVRSALGKADAQHQADMRRKLNSLWD